MIDIKLSTFLFFLLLGNLADCYSQNLLWNIDDIKSIPATSKEGLTIINNASKILKEEYISVTNKEKCTSGNKHNYESLAYYAWPDPSNPMGPYITKDGQPSPEYKYYDGTKIKDLNYRIKTLVQAYVLSNDSCYADYSLNQLRTWFLSKSTKMNPNFEYGQFIPGRNGGKGYPGSISEAYFFVDVLEGIATLNNYHMISKSENKRLKKWFKALEKWLIKSNLGIRMHNVTDNLGIMYDVLLYRIASYIEDYKVQKNIEKDFLSLRINKHIMTNGQQPLELKRTRAMMYSIYNLQHIVDFCCMLEANGNYYYSHNRDKIDAAMSYLTQFVGHKDKFPYTEIGDWKDLERQLKVLQLRIDKLKKIKKTNY